jgi:hypothetical protein
MAMMSSMMMNGMMDPNTILQHRIPIPC